MDHVCYTSPNLVTVLDHIADGEYGFLELNITWHLVGKSFQIILVKTF